MRLRKQIALCTSRMLDVNSGSMIHDPVILIQDEKIIAAEPSLKIAAGAEVVDLFVMKGGVIVKNELTAH